MTAPITGPNVQQETKVANIDGEMTIVSHLARLRYKQAKPFSLPLPYYANRGSLLNFKKGDGSGGPTFDPRDKPIEIANFDFTDLNNRSYEQLKGKLYHSAALGVDFAEFRQSVSMISSTCTTLVKLARAVKKGDFITAQKVLRMKFLPKGVSKSKSFGNNFLEYHFGWEPLISDVYDACEVINNPVKSLTLEKGKAKSSTAFSRDLSDSYVISNYKGSIQAYAQQGARVKAINNLTYHTLDQLGLNNPAVIAWELVPYSFVVDWFANVGDFLSSFTDFSGMTLVDSFHTFGYRARADGTWGRRIGYGDPPYLPRSFGSSYSYMVRNTSLSGVSLSLRPLKGPSTLRGVTAISLLLQHLPR